MSATRTSATPVPTAPVSPAGRYELIDTLRGFALFGVLLSNVLYTALEFALDDEQRAELPAPLASGAVELLALQFVGLKFYTIFSILFGLGFAIQLERLRQRGPGALRTYIRRLIVLLVIGLTHAVFLWFGDILQFYAVVGLALILFRNRSDRCVLATSIAIGTFVGFTPVLLALVGSGTTQPDLALRFRALTEGGYTDILAMNWQFFVAAWTDASLSVDGFLYWVLSVLWKFLLGFWIGRRRIFQDTERFLPVYRRWFTPALIFGLLGNAIMVVAIVALEVWVPEAGFPWNALWLVVEAAILSLSLAYMFGIAILGTRPKAQRSMRALGRVGRMALTHYLTHSVLFVALFYGIGLGWLGKMNAIHGLLLSIAIFAIQILASRWWLARFAFGPMEWIWRCLTYGRRIPIRSR